MTDELWSALPYDAWKATYATLHMWTQVVAKVALAQAPPFNHSWAVALQVTPRGALDADTAPPPRSFAIQFDFIEHQLVICASGGETRTLALRPQTGADFYREVTATLDAMGLAVKIWPMPSETPSPIRFDQDTVHPFVRPGVRKPLLRILLQSACELGEFILPYEAVRNAASPDQALWRSSTRPTSVPARLRAGTAQSN